MHLFRRLAQLSGCIDVLQRLISVPALSETEVGHYGSWSRKY